MAQFLRSLILEQRVPGSIPSKAQKIVSNAARSITTSDCGAGAVDDKDLVVSSN